MGGGAMPGVEIQANILQSLLEGRNLRTLSRAEAGVVFMVLTLATILLGLFLPMRYAALSSAALGLAYLIVAVGLSSQDILLPIVYPFGLITGVTTFDVLYRYKDEHNRRRFIEHAFGRYVAPAVVEKLVKGETPLALGGSKQELTILFSDIRGFTSLSEKLPPEELVKFLNSYLTAMSNVVLGAQGTIDKFIGDALMAFWGAPVAQEHQAVRAVLAALHMRKVLTEFNWRALKNGQPAIEIGIGINTGEVIVGNMGSERRFDYTVIGDDVNLASRLESLTKFYGVGILITKATKDKLGDGFLTRMVDIVAVKGKQLPVRVYEVIADLEEATPAEKEFVLKSYQALELYYDKKFAEAEPKFVELGNVIFAERCRTYIINPPGEDWVGVFIAQDK
jgi:adenylate cyclase